MYYIVIILHTCILLKLLKICIILYIYLVLIINLNIYCKKCFIKVNKVNKMRDEGRLFWLMLYKNGISIVHNS